MKITSRLVFTASPDRVADMFANPSFARYLAEEVSVEIVTATQIDKGMTVVFSSEITDTGAIKKLVGSQVLVTETTTWEEASGDGSRVGRLTMTIAGVPAAIDGPLVLKPAESGAEVNYDADLIVRIPLIGKQVEKMVSSYLNPTIAAWERVGNAWLAQQDQPESGEA